MGHPSRFCFRSYARFFGTLVLQKGSTARAIYKQLEQLRRREAEGMSGSPGFPGRSSGGQSKSRQCLCNRVADDREPAESKGSWLSLEQDRPISTA